MIVYGVLFGYKGVLQVLALLLAFRTRNVKVKGLDDSVYIAASVYVTSIVLTVIIVSTYTLRDYVNAYPAVVGMGLLLGTTMIVGLVFIPRVRNISEHLMRSYKLRRPCYFTTHFIIVCAKYTGLRNRVQAHQNVICVE